MLLRMYFCLNSFVFHFFLLRGVLEYYDDWRHYPKLRSASTIKKLPSIGDRGQTDRVTTLPFPHALDSVAAAGLGRVAPHASPRYRAADGMANKLYMYGRQSVLIGRRSRYSCSTHFCVDLYLWPWFSIPASYGHDSYTCKNQGQRSVRWKDRVETKLASTDIYRYCRSLLSSELVNATYVLLELISVRDGAFLFAWFWRHVFYWLYLWFVAFVVCSF